MRFWNDVEICEFGGDQRVGQERKLKVWRWWWSLGKVEIGKSLKLMRFEKNGRLVFGFGAGK